MAVVIKTFNSSRLQRGFQRSRSRSPSTFRFTANRRAFSRSSRILIDNNATKEIISNSELKAAVAKTGFLRAQRC